VVWRSGGCGYFVVNSALFDVSAPSAPFFATTTT
jgi:hypothetical protein